MNRILLTAAVAGNAGAAFAVSAPLKGSRPNILLVMTDKEPYQPENRGFDEVFIHGAGGIGQNDPGSQGAVPGTGYFNPIIKHNGTFEQTGGYCTDVFFRQALGWIKQNKIFIPFSL